EPLALRIQHLYFREHISSHQAQGTPEHLAESDAPARSRAAARGALLPHPQSGLRNRAHRPVHLQPRALRFPDTDPFPRDRQAPTEITGTPDTPGKSPPRFPRESAYPGGSSEEGEGDSARPPHGGSVCRAGTQESRWPPATLFPLSR